MLEGEWEVKIMQEQSDYEMGNPTEESLVWYSDMLDSDKYIEIVGTKKKKDEIPDLVSSSTEKE